MVLKDRLDHLRGIVKTEKKVKVTELSQRFDVTEETIRRDLERLELEGLITRTHGGAVLKVENMFDRLGYTHRSRTNVEEKKKIAQIVASIIPMQATLFADASSTVMEALTLMADRDDITVLTNSIPVLSSLNQSGLNHYVYRRRQQPGILLPAGNHSQNHHHELSCGFCPDQLQGIEAGRGRV